MSWLIDSLSINCLLNNPYIFLSEVCPSENSNLALLNILLSFLKIIIQFVGKNFHCYILFICYDKDVFNEENYTSYLSHAT